MLSPDFHEFIVKFDVLLLTVIDLATFCFLKSVMVSALSPVIC